MSNVTFTVAQVLELMKNGFSQREVARQLGKESQESTVRNMLKREIKNRDVESVQELLEEYDSIMGESTFGDRTTDPESVSNLVKNSKYSYDKAKILFLDIETAPCVAHIWSLWQNGVGLNQLMNDWYILSFTAKWADSDEVFYADIREKYDQEDDKDLLVKLWGFLDDADFVVGHNIRKFDMKKINSRFILNGMEKPSEYRMIDTLLIAKEVFGFTSNKLEYLTDKLCKKYKKSKHGKFPGHKLWTECLKGNIEAWEEMEEYNKFDVLSNQELYEVFMPWSNKLPNFDLYMDEEVDMSDWVEDGYWFTNLGKYHKYRNKVTGQQRRGRTNLLPKEKRQQLLANILN